MFASFTHLGMAMTLESEKRRDDKSYNAAHHVQSWLPKVCVVNNFKTQVKFFLYLAVVLSAAFAKPANPCNIDTQFWVENEDGTSSCVDCETCPPGQSLSQECGKQLPYTAMVNCVSCKSGVSFSDKYDSSSCTPCSSCADDQVVLRNCTPEWDIKCGKQCYSEDRYYDEDKGDCLPCSKCCHDDQDVVETECKKKLGAGSDKICSLHSSVNRCDQLTPSPQKPTAITTIQNTSMSSSGASPSQSSKQEHNVPPTALAHHHLHVSTGRGLVFLISFSIPVVLALLMIFGCYVWKARQMCIYSWCGFKSETDNRSSGKKEANKSTVVRYKADGNSEVTVVEVDVAGTRTRNVTSTDSLKPLLGEDNQEEQTCSHPQDSKLLSSLLDHEKDLKEISVRLDTTVRGVGNYRVVAQHYGFNHYEISSVFEKDARGPSTALIESLAASKPGLTVYEFAFVVGEKAKRKDVVEVLLAYNSTEE